MRPPPIFLLTFILASALVLTLFGVSAISPNTGAKKQRAAEAAAANLTPLAAPTVDFSNPSLGPNDAKVTVVEFADYLCGPCGQSENEVTKLLAEYAGKIRVVWKDFPNSAAHPDAVAAAEAARCADIQGAFWDYHDILFANQASATPQNFGAFAALVKIDAAALEACLGAERTKPLVERDFVEGQRLGIDGTPYFFVGKTRLSGAVSYDELRNAVEAELRAIK